MNRPKRAIKLLAKMLPYGISQTELAAAVGVSVDYVNMVFCGRYVPKGDFFGKCESTIKEMIKERKK